MTPLHVCVIIYANVSYISISERIYIMEWTKLRQDEFKAAVEKSNKVCIIPIGCVEAHGIHLPLGCDVFHGRYIAAKAAYWS